MKQIPLSLRLLSAFALGSMSTNLALAQDLPATQPKLITIVREEVKIGRGAEHAKHEAGWPAAYEKAKSPYYYLAMTSLTGPNEAWYVSPWESHAALADSMKREDKDPVLSAELARLSLRDADYISGFHIIQAIARPDLSMGTFPDLGKARFFAITIFRVRPGYDTQFAEAAKAYGSARKRAAVMPGYRVYQVIAGMPAPTFFVFSSVEDYGEFDQTLAADQATWKATTPEELALLQKCSAEGLLSTEENRFKLDPVQSYVPKTTRDKDPEFWLPK